MCGGDFALRNNGKASKCAVKRPAAGLGRLHSAAPRSNQMFEAVAIALVVLASAAVLFLRDDQGIETQPDKDIAALYCISLQEACDHEHRFGESERMWSRMNAYEFELKRRGFDPDKVWAERSRT